MSWYENIFGENYNGSSGYTNQLPDLNEEPVRNDEHHYVGQPTYPSQFNPTYDFPSQQSGYLGDVYGSQPGYVYDSVNAPLFPDCGNFSDVYGTQPVHIHGSQHFPPYGDAPLQDSADDDEEAVDEEAGDDEADDDDQGNFPSVSFKTEEQFYVFKKMMAWVTCWGIENGYVITTLRSKYDSKNNRVRKIWLKCDRGGINHSTATVRRAGSIRINCPFKLVWRLEKTGVWKLVEEFEFHNHHPLKYLAGHPFARRLTSEEYEMVEEMHDNNIEPRNILIALKKRFKSNNSVQKDVNNAIQKIRGKKIIGETPMQRLLKLLCSKDYVYYTREDQSTNTLLDILFVHPTSARMWRAFPHVLIMDSTYKTNRYGMPLFQVVGATSTGKTISVACAFLSNEREETFLWVLGKLKGTLVGDMEPRAILTDRDLAMMSACAKTFPNAARFLCRFHIQQNILKKFKKAFEDDTEWKRFLTLWNTLCNSPSQQLYNRNYERLVQTFGYHESHKGLIEYLDINWLRDYKHMFVSFWVDRKLNFCESTTNRVEGMHATLKAYLRTNNGTLEQIVHYVDKIVNIQEVEITQSLEDSRTRVMNDHHSKLFDNLRGRISHKALDLLVGEYNKYFHLQEYGMICIHQLQNSCGLPCACMLGEYVLADARIPFGEIDVFWSKLDLTPFSSEEEVPVDVVQGLEEIKEELQKKPPAVQMSLLYKIRSVVFPGKTDMKPPVV